MTREEMLVTITLLGCRVYKPRANFGPQVVVSWEKGRYATSPVLYDFNPNSLATLRECYVEVNPKYINDLKAIYSMALLVSGI